MSILFKDNVITLVYVLRLGLGVVLALG